jgi:hypothetical protein
MASFRIFAVFFAFCGAVFILCACDPKVCGKIFGKDGDPYLVFKLEDIPESVPVLSSVADIMQDTNVKFDKTGTEILTEAIYCMALFVKPGSTYDEMKSKLLTDLEGALVYVTAIALEHIHDGGFEGKIHNVAGNVDDTVWYWDGGPDDNYEFRILLVLLTQDGKFVAGIYQTPDPVLCDSDIELSLFHNFEPFNGFGDDASPGFEGEDLMNIIMRVLGITKRAP